MLLLASLTTLILPASIFAQSELGTGAISGIVQDSGQAVVAGAQVTVSNKATGLVRPTKTNDAGQFNVPVLPAGTYTVQVEMQGFAKLIQDDVTVNVGSTATMRLELKPGAVGEVVNVIATATIDTTKTDESTLVDRAAINDLPINGRRADQFALLTPGVARDGRFGLLSYHGQSGVFNNFTLEGNDDNQAYFSEARGRTRIASNISANAIQEFQVTQSNFLPEYGRSAGGGINSVIRSGTNLYHGDGFWYFRNQAFSARDPLATINPDESRHQFGGSVSGPIVKDRLLFFLNYDQQLRDAPLITQDLSGVLTTGLPANASAADVTAFNAGVADLRSRFPNGQPGNVVPRNFNQYLGLAKVDWMLTRRDTVTVTYNDLYAHALNGIQTPLVLGNVGRNGSDDVRIESLNVRVTSTITPSFLNEVRFQYGRDLEFEFGNQPPPQVFVGGFSFGRATFLERPALPNEKKLQLLDNISYTAGRHFLKFGGEINHASDNINNPANFGGSYSYSNALTYGRDLLNPAGKQYSSFQQSFGLPGIQFSTNDYAVFGQDQWKVRNNLTLNYGLRYDFEQIPGPIAPNPAVPQTQHMPQDATDFGPRVGLAWDIRSNGKTVIRAGWGLYYGRTPNGTIFNALTQTGLTDPTLNQISLSLTPTSPGAPAYPKVLLALPPGASGSVTTFRLDSNFKRPRIQEANAGIERQLMPNLVVSAGFIYTKGDRLPVSFDQNLPAPQFTRVYSFPDGSTVSVPFSAGITKTASGQTVNINASRPIPTLGAINVVTSIGETWYKALFVEVKRRFSKGFQFNVSYTLASAENLSGSGAADGSGTGPESPFGGSSVQNQFALNSNRGPSPTDQRHRMVVSGIWNLPLTTSDNQMVKGLVNGWSLSGIFTAESGRPFAAEVSVPSLPFTFQGAQYNGFGGLLGQGSGGDRNIAPNIPRDSNYGDANYRIDLRVSRVFRLTERFSVQVLGEGFNIFNRSNFNGFNTTLYDAQPTTVATAVTTPVVLTQRTNFGLPNADGSQPDGTNARRFQLAFRFRF
jgi:hypothetical protein